MSDYPGAQFRPSMTPDARTDAGPEDSADPGPDFDTAQEADLDKAQEAGFDRAQEAGFDGAREADSERGPDADSHPLVEETTARLDDLRDRPVADHAEVYADVHERLQAALVEADAEHGDRA